MALERFDINHKVKNTLEKDTNVKIRGIREGIKLIRQIFNKQIIYILQSFKRKLGN